MSIESKLDQGQILRDVHDLERGTLKVDATVHVSGVGELADSIAIVDAVTGVKLKITQEGSLQIPIGAATAANQTTELSLLNDIKTNTANIKIEAESVNLNTDTLELLITSTNDKSDNLLTELQLKADLTETQPVSLSSIPINAAASTSALQTTGNSSLADINAKLVELQTAIEKTNPYGSTSTRDRIQSATYGFEGFLIYSANPNRKEFMVLSHGNTHFHLYYDTSIPTNYYSAIELMGNMHETFIGDKYLGAVYGRFHESEIIITNPVTFQDSGDTVTKTAHGLYNNQEISFTIINLTSGFSINTTYFVINKTADTFQIALTKGGNIILLTTDGTGTAKYSTPLTGFINIQEILI